MGFLGPLVPEFAPTAVVVVGEVLLLVIALLVAPRNRRPSSALAWILLVVVLPLVGLVLFLLIGSPKLPKARREKQRRITERIAEAVLAADPIPARREVPPWLPAIDSLNRAGSALPLIDGNTARLLTTFEDQLAALADAARSAQRFLHIEFYILSFDDRVAVLFRALEAAVQRGVAVRVLLDHLGSRAYPGYRRALRELDRIGAEWHLMLPVQPLRGRYQRLDLRNHRKLLVADGELALVGSLNVIEPGYQRRGNHRRGLQWHDLLVEVRGPVVQEVDALFVTDWYSETDELLDTARVVPFLDDDPATLLCQIAPSGPAFDAENNLALFNSLLYAAERRVSITSPYFVPDESLLAAMVTAARRGVAVELFVGAIGDQSLVFHAQHSYYEVLLLAGVRIYEYPAPGILHAKHMSVDDLVCVVGSSNMDIRSFQLDLELSMLVCDRGFTTALREVEDGYRSISAELTTDDWLRRSPLHRIRDDLSRLTSAVQ
jgi:cardiolipin synthase A/B